MATLYVRDLPDQIYEAVKARAQANGRTLASEVRQLLTESVQPPRDVSAVVASIGATCREFANNPVDIDELLESDRTR
jgi:plasmid stability protein